MGRVGLIFQTGRSRGQLNTGWARLKFSGMAMGRAGSVWGWAGLGESVKSRPMEIGDIYEPL